MGAIHFSLDPKLLATLLAAGSFDVFIETGTFRGDTIATVVPYFREIHSVEQNPNLYAAAVERFSAEKNVTIHSGDSTTVLAALSPQLVDRRVLYWLDAHGCQLDLSTAEPDRSSQNFTCPLLDELNTIEVTPDSVILIDDARYFLTPPPHSLHATDWPRLDQIFVILQSKAPNHWMRIVNDVIIVYPPSFDAAVTEYANAHGVNLIMMMQRSAHAQALERHMATQVINPQAVTRISRGVLRRILGVLHRIRDFSLGNTKQLVQYPPRPGHVYTHLPSHYANASAPAVAPRISIVTPSFQQAAFLERTLRSVLEQEYPNLEYVVQDGGSTDGSLEILKHYEHRLHCVTSEPDTGQADAINRAFRKTSGEIMAWLNSDDILLPGSLAYVADYFVRHPEIDVVYGHRIQIDENDREIGRWVLASHNDHLLRWADLIPQETLFWRRSLWERTGAAVNADFQFAIDWELLLRFQSAGARFAHLPRFLGAFRVHDAQKTSRLLHSIGSVEMAQIRQKVHGRRVGLLETQVQIYPYMLRSAILDRALRWRLLRH